MRQVKAVDFEKYLKSEGSGAFGNIEYADDGSVILRTSDVKTTDMSGMVRIYFTAQRSQVISGRRFEPMGSGLLLLRPGSFYKVYTTLVIEKPLPEGVEAYIRVDDEISGVMQVISEPLRTGFVGPVTFMVQPYRRLEMERLTSLCTLSFFKEAISPKKSGNSTRTKKEKKPVDNLLGSNKEKSEIDVPVEPSDSEKEKSGKDSVSKTPKVKGGKSDANGSSDQHTNSEES